jgi:excisionase family DNA binding protein
MSDKLTSKKGAAQMFSVSERTIDRMLSSGELTKIKIRGCVRVKVAEIKRLLGEEVSI